MERDAIPSTGVPALGFRDGKWGGSVGLREGERRAAMRLRLRFLPGIRRRRHKQLVLMVGLVPGDANVFAF